MSRTVYQAYADSKSTLPFAVWAYTEAGEAAAAARSTTDNKGPGVPWPGEYVPDPAPTKPKSRPIR